MLYLILSVVCSVVIANLLVLFTRRRQINLLQVFTGNYLVASIFSLASLPQLQLFLPANDVVMGIMAGALFLSTFWAYQRSITVNGLSLTAGFARISVLIPVLIALLAFGEKLIVWNILGIILALAAFSLRMNIGGLHNFVWLIALFLLSGIADASLKIYKEVGSGADEQFVFIIFTAAFLISVLSMWKAGKRLHILSITMGCLLGIPNRLSTVFFLKCLNTVPAEVAYPFFSAAGMLSIIICDVLIWKKQVTRQDIILWAMLLGSLVLLNLR